MIIGGPQGKAACLSLYASQIKNPMRHKVHFHAQWPSSDRGTRLKCPSEPKHGAGVRLRKSDAMGDEA
jgi:hypothetical protein